jgi:hypothetical protein
MLPRVRDHASEMAEDTMHRRLVPLELELLPAAWEATGKAASSATLLEEEWHATTAVVCERITATLSSSGVIRVITVVVSLPQTYQVS